MRSILIIASLIIGLIAYKWATSKPTETPSGQPASKPSGGPPTGSGGAPGGGKPMPVSVYVAALTPVENEIFVTGTIVANEDVELRPETSGRLIGLYIREGAAVAKGQLIAKIKDDEIRARIKKVKLEQELADQTAAREQKLLDANAISREEVDITNNRVKTLAADLEALQVALSQTELRAPFAGRIGLKNISVGAYVSPSTVIGRLVQTSPAKLDFAVPEKYSQRISVGKKVQFATDLDPAKRDASIVAIEPIVDEALRTVKVRATTPNPSGRLLPGNFVKVSTKLGASKSIMMPSEAIIPFIGGKKVFIIKEGKAVEKTIVTGVRTEKEVEVIEGLSVGDSIVVSGIMSIKNGQAVKPKNK